ncbi:MAG: flagellar biosynthesis anti-sigma factor FlgM [Anaerolinea sp.]|nr:flagellar biosynthesis anti-sigma factor FlgM [Anaerolinea sp.]
MKIDDVNPTASGTGQVGRPVVPVRPARSGAGPDPAITGAPAGAPPAATVELSIRVLELHAARRAVEEAPDVRADVVDDVRSRLADGRYRLDADVTARGILDRRA